MLTDNFVHKDFCNGFVLDIGYGECFCPFRAHIQKDQDIAIIIMCYGQGTTDVAADLLKWCYHWDWKEWCRLALLGGLFHGTMFAAQAPVLDIHVHLRPEIAIPKLGIGLVYSEVTASRYVMCIYKNFVP